MRYNKEQLFCFLSKVLSSAYLNLHCFLFPDEISGEIHIHQGGVPPQGGHKLSGSIKKV